MPRSNTLFVPQPRIASSRIQRTVRLPAVVQRHALEGSALEHLDVPAVVARDRKHRPREPQPSTLNVPCIAVLGIHTQREYSTLTMDGAEDQPLIAMELTAFFNKKGRQSSWRQPSAEHYK